MSETTQAIQAVLALAGDEDFQREVAQVRAKAVLTEILGEAPTYRWTYAAPRLVRNVTAALFDLERISLEEPTRVAQLQLAARQFAQAWESLSTLGERTTRLAALTNAAAAYELAGYQANAVCIARQIACESRSDESPTLTELAALFIQRLFLQVRSLAVPAKQQPKLDGTDPEELWRRASVAMASDGLLAASKFFLSGDSRHLTDASNLLSLAEQGFVQLGRVIEANLTYTLKSLLPLMESRSTWSVVGRVSTNPRWQRYLKLLGRGVGQDVYRSSSISELWPSQVKALERGLLDSSSNKFFRMPTSAGKTRVAELAMVHTLVSHPAAKCVYIAPYRALVAELQQVFIHLFGDLGYRVSTVVGAYESDDFEQLLLTDADILVLTPEKLDLLR